MGRLIAVIFFYLLSGCFTSSEKHLEELMVAEESDLKTWCEGGDGDACFEIARRLEFKCSKDSWKDLNIASELHFHVERGCNLGNKKACHDLGWTYQNGIDTKKDLARALELFEKACEKDAINFGCIRMAYHYKESLGVAVDYKKALGYSKKACEGGDGVACCYMGQNYHFGQGVSVDYVKARSYYEKSCNLNDDCGCMGLRKSRHLEI